MEHAKNLMRKASQTLRKPQEPQEEVDKRYAKLLFQLRALKDRVAIPPEDHTVKDTRLALEAFEQAHQSLSEQNAKANPRVVALLNDHHFEGQSYIDYFTAHHKKAYAELSGPEQAHEQATYEAYLRWHKHHGPRKDGFVLRKPGTEMPTSRHRHDDSHGGPHASTSEASQVRPHTPVHAQRTRERDPRLFLSPEAGPADDHEHPRRK